MSPERKTFTIDVVAGSVTPSLHHASLSNHDEVEWVVNDGSARVVFDPSVSDPVDFSGGNGPDFDWQNPAVGTVQASGTFLHTIRCWYDLGGSGNKEQESLMAVLIVDP